MKKTISITLHRRPDYTKIMLDRLSLCEGLDEYEVYISVDYANDEVVALAEKFQPHKLNVNKPKLGCDSNTFLALRMAFEDGRSDFNVHLEDDIVPSKDCLLFFNWCGQHYKDDLSVFSIHAYNKLDTKKADIVKRLTGFGSWGWAGWRRTWEEVKNKTHSAPGFDVNFNKICGQRDRIYPLLARVQQIGEQNGLHVKPAEHRLNHFNKVWADDKVVISEFHENGRGSWQGE